MSYKKLVTSFCLICCFFYLQGCATGRNAQFLQEGKKDFAAGDYKNAFHQLLPLASDGNPQAQYAVGYMYYYGLGVTQDAESGIFWMQRAADRNNQHAVKALEMIHNH